MGPRADAERVAGRERRLRRCALAAALCWAAVTGCSVYGPSLTNGSATLPVTDGAGGTVTSEADAGGSAGSADISSLAGGGAQGGGSAQGGATAAGSGTGAAGDSAAAGSSTGGAVAAGGGGAGMPAGGGAGGVSAGGGGAGSAGGGPVLKELASGKSVTASSQQTGNEAPKGNDASTTTRWCAVNGNFPQWWRVDLGATHALRQVVVQFEHPDRKYYYVIETSQDDAAYTQQAMVNGTGAVQTVDLPPNVSARYLRITVTNGIPSVVGSTTYPTWASFFDLAVMGS